VRNKLFLADTFFQNFSKSGSQRPRPSGQGLKKGNNSLAASIPTLPGGALKGGGKKILGSR